MTRAEVKAALMEVNGVGEATASSILDVLDEEHPQSSFDGFEDGPDPDALEQAAQILGDTRRAKSVRIQMATDILGGDDA